MNSLAQLHTVIVELFVSNTCDVTWKLVQFMIFGKMWFITLFSITGLCAQILLVQKNGFPHF